MSARTETDGTLPWREREYSPSSCIGGDYAPYLDAYARRSGLALQTGARHSEQAYGAKSTQKLDLFLPQTVAQGAMLPPLLLFIHGGYWQELSRASSLFAAPSCTGAGFAYAAIDYTLAPAASLQDIVIECRDAMRWLHRHGLRLGFDPDRIVVAGSSAGAHLAAMCCVRDWAADRAEHVMPAAAVLVSGIYDLQPLVGTSINQALSLDAARAHALSPQWMALDGFPASVVCWGQNETSEFKRQGRDFASLLNSYSAKQGRCIEVQGRNHFDVILELCAPGTPLGDATLALLAA